MSDEAKDQSSEGTSGAGGISKEKMAEAGRAAFGDAAGVILRPADAIPRVVNANGFVLSGIILGAYVILMMLFYLFGTKVWIDTWPPFKSVLRELIAQAALVALLAGGVFVCATALFEKKQIGFDKALNVVAVGVIPVLLLELVIFIFKVIWDDPVPILMPLQTAALVLFIAMALQSGLEFKPVSAVFTVLVCYLVAYAIYAVISEADSVASGGAFMAEMNRAMGNLQNSFGGL